MKPTSTKKAPAAIRKFANAIPAISRPARTPRARCDVAAEHAIRTETSRPAAAGRLDPKEILLWAGSVTDLKRGRGGARRSPPSLIEWFVTPLDCRYDSR
jgi:hypothetical protein